MANLVFNEGGARAWKAKAEDLNRRTEMSLRAVASCLETLQKDSVGEMVDEIGVTGAQIIEHTAQMAQSLSALISTVERIISSLAQAVMETVAQVISGRGKSTNF